jgi:hypothetical protein
MPRSIDESVARRWGARLAAAGALFIGLLTLWPVRGAVEQVGATPPWCLVCGDTGTVDALLNLALFVPLGFGLRLAGWPLRRAVLLAASATLLVEILQMKVVPGRDASLGDLVTNTLGGWLGWSLQSVWRRLAHPGPREARRLALGGLAAWLALGTLTGWALERSFPGVVYRTEYAPPAGETRFSGRVLAAAVDTLPLPRGVVGPSRELVAHLVADSVRFGVTLVSGRPTTADAPIVGVYNRDGRIWSNDILVLAQDGRDLVFQMRLRTRDLRLRTPTLRLADALPGRAGDTLRIAGGFWGDRLHAATTHGAGAGEVRELVVALSPNWTWALLLPFERPLDESAPWLTAAWLVGVLLPLGFWAGRAARIAALPAPAVVAAGVAAGLVGIPPLLRLPAVAWQEWAGAAAGLAAGGALAWARARRARRGSTPPGPAQSIGAGRPKIPA